MKTSIIVLILVVIIASFAGLYVANLIKNVQDQKKYEEWRDMREDLLDSLRKEKTESKSIIDDTLCFSIPNSTSGMLCYPPDELEKFSCTKSLLEYLYESSNLLDDDYGGIYLQNSIGLPDGITHEQFDRYVEFILDARRTGKATINYEIKSEVVTYGNQYEIFNGTVDEITYDADSNSLIISLQESEKGYVQIVIPSELFTPINKAPVVNYIVLQDGEEISFEQFSHIILKIPFEKDTKKIEIIGAMHP